jgi:hypothetical protein
VAEFEDLREQLNGARSERAAAEDALRAAREARRRIDAEEEVLDRTLDPENDEHAEAKKQLEQRRRELAEQTKRREGALSGARELEAELTGKFGELSDPRKGVERLDDGYPMLLFPVRLETRFKDVDGRPQLWVRIFPDDCSIDTFEETLSDVEVANAKRYWQELWRAGRVENDERGAWRGLVGSHGSGRAAWIVQNYVPVNEIDHPTKADPADVVLVVSTETPLSGDEPKHARTYWEEVWRAGDDGARVANAHAALVSDVGAARAEVIVEHYRPFNLDDVPTPPLERDDVGVVAVEFLIFPADVETKLDSWSKAPHAVALPDRFVLSARAGNENVEALGKPVRSPLIVGPDPSAPPEDQIQPDNGGIAFPEELRWLVDFDRAVDDGLGFRIDLTETQAQRGFDRLFVLGVRLSASESDGQAQLEELIAHHHHGRSGFELIPQGRPSNNTEKLSSGYRRGEDADGSFDDTFLKERLFEDMEDVHKKADGQRLAEALGIRTDVLGKVRGGGGADGAEARATQTALWPATLGYMMSTLLDPVFDEDDIELTRGYFTRYVSGRGSVPAVRIGRQPYGILPTTAFSRLSWLDNQEASSHVRRDELLFLRRLHAVLASAGEDWGAMANQASFVGKAGDPHELLLDILGLHPASVEFHYRYAESLDHLFNGLNLLGFGAALMTLIRAAHYHDAGLGVLRRYGYTSEEEPDLLSKFFYAGQDRLSRDVIDDRPLSEVDPVRDYTTDGRNYLEWLLHAARTSLEALRRQQGFLDDRAPGAVLYLLLRHALMLGYHEASYLLYRLAAFLPPESLTEMKREPAFVHVQEAAATSESRFAPLYAVEPRITQSQDLTVAEHIALRLGDLAEGRVLQDQLDALDLLTQTPTARLERLLAEHVDTCTYRYDAWLLGLVNLQLEAMRSERAGDEGQPHREGVYLGAYAWLEDVRPENKVLMPVRLEDQELAKVFAGGTPLMRDSTNGGFVLSPSLNHAVTAAVLRNGYLANASPDTPGALAVNLSSERVRLALGALEGMRAGQSLGALLGYRLERGLHDRHAVAEVDRFIYALRKAFPLHSDKLERTRTDPDVPIDQVDARNVVDGLQLVERVRSTGNANYPFGLDLEPANSTEAGAIDAEVQRLLDLHDAVADLALAEGVHQAVQGNFDRVASTMDAYAQGHYPPDPEVVRTPSSGITLTHRIGLQLEPGPPAPSGATPRATAEPALDAWLEGIVPPLASIGCTVAWTDPVSGTDEEEVVRLSQLGVRPLDLLYLVQTDAEQAMLELDDRVLRRVIDTRSPRPDSQLAIRYMDGPAGGFSIFETAPLVRSLRSLLLRARPLRATDIRLANEATSREEETSAIDVTRVQQVKDDLDAAAQDVTDYLAVIDPLLADPVANRAALIAGIDGFLDDAAELLSAVARFAVPQTGWGFAYAWRRARFVALLGDVRELVGRWDDRLARFDDLVGEYDGPTPPPTADEKFALLRRAEAFVSTEFAPQPAQPDDLRATLTTKRGTFATRLGHLRDLLDTSETTVAGLLGALGPLLPLGAFDPDPLTLTEAEDAVVAFVGELAAVGHAVATALAARSEAAQKELDAHAGASTPKARVEALERALKALLGDDARVIPEFTVATAHGDEWQNAFAAGAGGSLLSFLTGPAGVDLPVDEWLYGVARVREKLGLWERIVMFTGAFEASEPELTPIQLPHRPGDPWLALQFPEDYVLDRDMLLYTAHYAQPFDKTQPQCGLLLDEWTEVVPATEVLETNGTKERVASHQAGLTFHSDRSNCEPGQSLLLVTPATWDGRWQWADLLGALEDTLELAKKRTVEPLHVDGSAYAPFLPATVAVATLRGITISLAYAMNNRAVDLVPGAFDG